MKFNKRMFVCILDECNLNTPQFFSNEDEYLSKLKSTFGKLKDNCIKQHVLCNLTRIYSC